MMGKLGRPSPGGWAYIYLIDYEFPSLSLAIDPLVDIKCWLVPSYI